MQFKHPEILYALFLLIIPIIVHLFQLRRFEKVPFTNVKFLKEVELQTRRSSRLKKLLILFLRLLLLIALIFAFAQPFLSNASKKKPIANYIYLDNSFSMQAKGIDGELLKRAAQEIIEAADDMEKVHLFTNNQVFENLTVSEIKNTLLSIDYHPINKNLRSVLLQMSDKISDDKTSNNIFLVSDFQSFNIDDDIVLDSANNYYISNLQPRENANISIDSVYISSQSNEQINLRVIVKKYGNLINDNASISLFIDNLLAGRSSVNFNNKQVAEIEFTVANSVTINGKLQIEDTYLPFDNTFYFCIKKPKKINVAVVGNNNDFLSKIYIADEFNLTSTTLNNFDYNAINDQHLLVLNELETIPPILSAALEEFLSLGGSITIIPPLNADMNSYNALFQNMNLGRVFKDSNKDELAITTINFSHPFLKGVFEKEIKNFQYPTVKNRYQASLKNATSILSFENGLNFIAQINKNQDTIYWVSAPLNTENTNFKNSPLVVPVFYNFAFYSLKPSELYYTIGKYNNIEINEIPNKDEVLHLINENEDFIPMQKITSKKVILTVEDNPQMSGFMAVVKNDDTTIKELAFNYDRKESDLTYSDIENYFKNDNIAYSNSVNKAFTAASDKYKTTNLWQYFLLLAFLLIVTEILLLKFFKS